MLGRSKSYHQLIMGNCIGTDMVPSEKRIPLKSLDGVEEEFEVSRTVWKIICRSSEGLNSSGLQKAQVRDSKLKSKEFYRLIPNQSEHCGLPPSRRSSKDSYRGKRVKIVLSKQQLEQLVKSMKKIPCSRVATIQSLRARKRYKKWIPSLATIPEL